MDTFAVWPRIIEDDEAERLMDAPPKYFAGIVFQGGVLGRDHWFRGEHYAELVEEITGVSLRQPYIPPGTVAQMYQTLRGHRWEPYRHRISAPEWVALVRFFEVCVRQGFALEGK